MIHQEGPPHKRNYIMGVLKGSSENIDEDDVKEKCIGFGLGNSKRQGEQNSAKMALIMYGYLKEDQYTNEDIYYPNWKEIEESKLNENNENNEINENVENSETKEIEVDDLENKVEIESYSELFT
jgi:hypothetical protein